MIVSQYVDGKYINSLAGSLNFSFIQNGVAKYMQEKVSEICQLNFFDPASQVINHNYFAIPRDGFLITCITYLQENIFENQNCTQNECMVTYLRVKLMKIFH